MSASADDKLCGGVGGRFVLKCDISFFLFFFRPTLGMERGWVNWMEILKVVVNDGGCILELPCGLPGMRYHVSTSGKKGLGSVIYDSSGAGWQPRSFVSITILVPKCEYFPNPRTLRGRVLETYIAKHIPFGDYSIVSLELTR